MTVLLRRLAVPLAGFLLLGSVYVWIGARQLVGSILP